MEEKTGLVLGGGGAKGAYEVDVWQALRELGVSVRVVTGSSVGAINGALVVQGALDRASALWKELETHMVFDLADGGSKSGRLDFGLNEGDFSSLEALGACARELFQKGGFGVSGLKGLLQQTLDESAIRASSVEFGLVTAEFPTLKAHFFKKQDIPRGKLIDYILASAACFPAVRAYEIEGKQFIDGGYSDNLPVSFARELGADSIIAVNLEAPGVIRKKHLDRADVQIISSPWDLGSFLLFDKVNSRRILRLGYLDTFKAFGIYDGIFFSFAKGSFTKKELAGADAAARFFSLDPEILYRKSVLNRMLRDAIMSCLKSAAAEAAAAGDGLFGGLKQAVVRSLQELRPPLLVLELARSRRAGEPESKGLHPLKSVKKSLKDENAAAEYILKESLLP